MRAYLDHAATTRLDPCVLAAMVPYLDEEFGNPSSIYSLGRRSKDAIEDARAKVATVFGSRPDEIVFTGSGTESDNLAILGVARQYRALGKHVVVSPIEHHAVLSPAKHLAKKEGFDITTLPVDVFGRVSPKDVAAALTSETVLVSVMYANNEVGTVEPIREIAKTIRDFKKANGRGENEPPFFHTDACQAAGYLDLDVKKLGVDLLTVNGSKVYGPKGIGALFVRRGVKFEPIMFGGGQEKGLRPGTENVAGIVGFAEAFQIADGGRDAESARLSALRDRLISGILERVPKVELNGHPSERLPNNVNLSILDIEGEAILLYLDEAGISAATGSACDSSSLDPSHVIVALGKPYEYAHASIRFTLGRETTERDVDLVLERLPEVAELLRSISPIEVKDGRGGETAGAFVAGRPHWEKPKDSRQEGNPSTPPDASVRK